jgi:hypothetical protein
MEYQAGLQALAVPRRLMLSVAVERKQLETSQKKREPWLEELFAFRVSPPPNNEIPF